MEGMGLGPAVLERRDAQMGIAEIPVRQPVSHSDLRCPGSAVRRSYDAPTAMPASIGALATHAPQE